MPKKGYKQSKEHRKNLQKSAKERIHPPDCTCGICDAKRGINHGFQKGFVPWHSGKTKEDDPRIGRIGNRINHPKGGDSSITGTKRSDGFKEKQRKVKQELYKDPEYKEKVVKAVLAGCKVKPNKKERLLNKTLQELLPNEYQLNVNTEVMILGSKIPDFVNINGQKKIIELFGDYWHGKRRTGRTKEREEQRRIDHFSKYGYQTLIIWERELKDISKVASRIMEFNNG